MRGDAPDAQRGKGRNVVPHQRSLYGHGLSGRKNMGATTLVGEGTRPKVKRRRRRHKGRR